LEAVYADYEKGSPSLLKEFFANSVDGLFPNGIVNGIPDSWERSILKYFVRKIAVKMAKDKMISMNSTDRYADVNTTRAKTKKWLDSIGLNNPQYKLNVVCGHTHIKDEYEYPSKIKLYNVGGWEIEQSCLEPECSVLFINDDGTTELKSI
jgi:UDP-2,3-diacylglucosamine pyrophosphatase LpxH